MKRKSLFILFMSLILSISWLVGCGTKTAVNGDNKNQQQVNTTENKSDVLTKVKDLANVGKVIGSDPFSVGSSRAEIERVWGKSKPGSQEWDPEDYTQQHISIYYESDQVDQIITTSPILKDITYDEVIKTLKEPWSKKSDEGITHLFDHAGAGNKYDLTVTLRGKEPKVSEITVGNIPTPDPDQVP